MALQLSIEAEAFLQQNNISGNIILDIDGFDSLYGSVKVTKVARYGEGLLYGDGTLYGGSAADDDSKDYISLTGTTNNISQKINQDRGGSSSITSFKIRLIDKNNELTRDFSPGVIVADILGREATVYWQAQGSKHPVDSARLFVGIISNASFGAGWVELVVSHPQALSRQKLLPIITTKLTTAMTDTNTLNLVASTDSFAVERENLKTYIKINDEIMRYTSPITSGFTGLTRGEFGTIASAHDVGDEVESFYRLQGGPIELALRLMLSIPNRASGKQNFATRTASRINQVDAVNIVPNSIFFDGINIQDELGLVVGDQVNIISGANVSNLIAYTNIISFGENSSGSYVVVDTTMTTEIDIAAIVDFKSKYNKLSIGAGENIKPYHVDVAQFEALQETFSAQFFDYDFFIKDDIVLDEFISTQLLYPSGMFSLPRQGRISAGISSPPIIGPKAKTINASNVTNAAQVSMSRSINEAFYNAIAYKFNEDAVEEKFLSAVITQSSDSTNRINVGNRVLDIECGGIRESELNRNKIETISNRYLDRWQYGAETVNVDVNFKTAFSVEPGDTVIFDGESLKVSDITQGTRNFLPRVFECIDRKINLKSGKCSLSLQDTNLSTRARYGTFAPASLVGVGSTLSKIVIKRSFGTEATELERDKWTEYLLQDIIIRSPDHSTVYETSLISLSLANPNIININPPLTGLPSENWIIEPPNYENTNKQEMSIYKSLHCFFNPQVVATGGTTITATVSPSDFAKFSVGAPIRIHLNDYSEDYTTTVAEVASNTITLKADAGFTITSSHLIDLIGFGDGGSPYAWF